MSIFLRPSSLKVKDANGNYRDTNIFAQKSTQEYLDAIEAKGEETLASIPQDYTNLSNEVSNVKAELTQVNLGYRTRLMSGWGWQIGRINSQGNPYIGDGYSKINSAYVSGKVIASAKLPYILVVNNEYKYKFEWRNLSSAESDISGLTYKYEEELDYVPDIIKTYCNEKYASVNSKNLIDKTQTISGEFVSAEYGDFRENVNFWRTDYLPITGGETYTLRYINQLAFYDKFKTFISGIAGYSADTSAQSSTFTTPNEAEYIVVCGHTSQLDSDQLEVGDSFTSYYPYKSMVNDEVLPQDTNISSILQYAKNTIRIKLIGDSITHGVGGTGFSDDGDIIIIKNGTWRRNPNGYCWANLLKEQLEAEYNCTVTNNAIRGKGTDFFVNNIDVLVGNDNDIVICMLGTNNRMEEYYSRIIPDIQYIYDYCHDRGQKFILMASVPASNSNENDKYIHMDDVQHYLHAVATKNKIGFIDVYSQFYNYAWYRGIDFTTLLADGLHPNDAGYYVIYRIIAEALGVPAKIENATWND